MEVRVCGGQVGNCIACKGLEFKLCSDYENV